MPKMKTHSGAAKRLHRTPTGKVVRAQAGVRHLLEGKSGQRRRRQQREDTVAKPDLGRIRRMLGG
ncbi:MAG: 50S ribosomal protein L35 [Actinomycetota bacterium]